MRVATLMLVTVLGAAWAAAEERPAFQALAPEDRQALLSWLAPRCVEPGGGGEAGPLLRERPGRLAEALLEAWKLGPTGDLLDARRRQIEDELELRRDLLGSEEARAALSPELLEMELRATEDPAAFVARGLERYALEWRSASLTGLGVNCARDLRGWLEGLAEGEDAGQRLPALEALAALERCD